MNRLTLSSPAHIEGITLFTGVSARLSILPAPAGHSITFIRTDLPSRPEIMAHVSRVVPENRRTVLSLNPKDPAAPTVQTVEHVLSALAGLAITAAILELSGPEVPMGDGSALPFVDAIRAAGGPSPASISDSAPTAEFALPAVVRTPIVIEDRGARIEAHPASRPGLFLEYHLDYPPGSGIPPQTASLDLPDTPRATFPAEYTSQIAPARTFSLAAEAQAARAMGMFTHLEPKDTLVIGPTGPIDNALRFPNEPARHKLLDLLGDLSLTSRPIHARIIARKTGHAHNHAMARALSAL